MGCILGWVPLLLTRRGFGSIFARLGARFLLWSLVPWGLSLLPVLRPGVLLAPIGCIFVWVPAVLGLPCFWLLSPPRSVVPWASAWPLVVFAPLGCSRSRLSSRHKLCINLDECPIGSTAYRFLALAVAVGKCPHSVGDKRHEQFAICRSYTAEFCTAFSCTRRSQGSSQQVFCTAFCCTRS